MQDDLKRRIWGWWLAILCGTLAFCIAREAGVPAWRNWQIGYAFDMGALTFLIVLSALRAIEEGEG